jgi:hypothetical protein
MNRRTTAAVLAGAALTLGLAACGSDSGGGYGGGGGAPEAPPPKPARAGADGFTPPGTKLRTNEAAAVGWTPPSTLSTAGARKAIPLEVTVAAIEKGSPADLEDVRLDADQRTATPYYVRLQVTNRGTTGPGRDDPDLTFEVVDDRGQRQPILSFIGGSFERCEDNDPPRPFARGESYDSCLTYLLKGGGSVREVRWGDGPAPKNAVPEYLDKPIVWSATPPPPGSSQP